MEAKNEASAAGIAASAPRIDLNQLHEATKVEPSVKDRASMDDHDDSSPAAAILHGPKLWLVIAALYLGVYLMALEPSMLATVLPTLTNKFGTLNDV